MHALADSSSGGSTAGGLILWILIIAAYWLPAIVAGIRHVPNAGSVTVIDAFLGWTLIGWVVALAMACRSVPQTAVAPAGSKPGWPDSPTLTGPPAAPPAGYR